MGKYLYRAFGLNILSDFELPELETGLGQQDVEILHGEVSETDADLSCDRVIRMSAEEIIYQLKDVAGCKVYNRGQAIIMPHPSLSQSTLRLLILTSVMGCILIQRKMVPLHGSSVTMNGEGIILAGQSGAGKSTLTSTFIKKGFRFLSDDVSVIDSDDNGDLYVQPSYPYRKLHRDSIDNFKLDVSGLERIEREEEKYLIPVHESFESEPRKLRAFIEIVPMDKVEEVSIERIRGAAKLRLLMDNLYRGNLSTYFDSKVFYFEQIGKISANLDVFRLVRPKHQFTCDKQAELILNELGIH